MRLFGYEVTEDDEMRSDWEEIVNHYYKKYAHLPKGKDVLAMALSKLAESYREEKRVWDYTERPESCKGRVE